MEQEFKGVPAWMLGVEAVFKAESPYDAKHRDVRMQVSSQEKDNENDVVLQSALLNSAEYYVANGNVDQDHLTLIGHQLPHLQHSPYWYEIGRPSEVLDIGSNETDIIFRVYKSPRGHDPIANSYDAFWDSLFTDPPAVWRASIGGPITDADRNVKGLRMVVKGLRWCNTAVTKNPQNHSLKGIATPIMTKSILASTPCEGLTCALAPALDPGFELHKSICPHLQGEITEDALVRHYRKCEGYRPVDAHLLAAAFFARAAR